MPPATIKPVTLLPGRIRQRWAISRTSPERSPQIHAIPASNASKFSLAGHVPGIKYPFHYSGLVILCSWITVDFWYMGTVFMSGQDCWSVLLPWLRTDDRLLSQPCPGMSAPRWNLLLIHLPATIPSVYRTLSIDALQELRYTWPAAALSAAR